MRHEGKTILLSAYACEPFRGSEPGTGWNWAVEIAALGHEVWVLTQPEHEPAISRALALEPNDRLHFVYVGLPVLDHWSRMPRPVSAACYLLHVYLWQLRAYVWARALHRRLDFDLVHHLTIGSIRVPSLMGRLGAPFVYGPIAGGDCPPKALRASFPRKARRYELIREISNRWIRLDPFVQGTLRRAAAILATTHQTQALLPTRYQAKSQVQPSIGTPSGPMAPREPRNRASGDLKLMFAGRLLCWKGVHLALKALAEARAVLPGIRMTIIGNGPDEAWLKALAHDLGLDTAIDWIAWLKQEEVMQAYAEHDVFLFPSMRDSGGNVVLEALGSGLPVVCLDLGGPGVLVDPTCGRVVPTSGETEATVVAALKEALLSLARDPRLLAELGRGALERAKQFTWSRMVGQAYASLRPLLEGPARPVRAELSVESR